MIDIYLNGERQQIAPSVVLQTVLVTAKVKPPYAVMINNKHIVRGEYHTTILQSGDRIQLMAPMQGG